MDQRLLYTDASLFSRKDCGLPQAESEVNVQGSRGGTQLQLKFY